MHWECLLFRLPDSNFSIRDIEHCLGELMESQCNAVLVWVLAMALSLCLCLSQVGILSKRLNELGWFLAWKLVSTYPILCFMDIQVPSKIRVLSPGTLLQTPDEACYQRSSRNVDARNMIYWAIIIHLSGQCFRAVMLDHCSLSHRLSSSVYSTILSRGSVSDSWHFLVLCLLLCQILPNRWLFRLLCGLLHCSEINCQGSYLFSSWL